jgi:hypothetical protein
LILNACRSVESARSPPFFFFTTLATLTPPVHFSPTPPRVRPRRIGHRKRSSDCWAATACKKKRPLWHRATAGTGRTGGLPGTSSPTPAISLAPSKLGACWNPAHSRLGSSWHTDALPPQLPCAWPELSHPRAARRFRLMAPHGTTSQHPRSTAPPCTAAPHCTWSSAPAHLLCAHPAPHLC